MPYEQSLAGDKKEIFRLFSKLGEVSVKGSKIQRNTISFNSYLLQKACISVQKSQGLVHLKSGAWVPSISFGNSQARRVAAPG